jgi:2-polyprenyl-6-methoxyphenol hydroxylase-like FAD-dependent oxidoreductase
VPEGVVTAHFEDGTCTSGDGLVGTDGVSSRLREEFLPYARRVETGIVAVSAKAGLSDEVRQLTPQPILRGPTLILGPGGCFMFASAVDYEDATAGGREHYDREKYVMWGGRSSGDAWFAGEPLSNQWRRCKSRGDCSDGRLASSAAAGLVLTADLATITTFAVKTSLPIPPCPTQKVTLLGDALHNMTPFRGSGANTALRAAAGLRRALVAVSRGEADLIQTLATYERDMIGYGFAAVQTSLKDMKRFHAKGLLAGTVAKSFFRSIM